MNCKIHQFLQGNLRWWCVYKCCYIKLFPFNLTKIFLFEIWHYQRKHLFMPLYSITPNSLPIFSPRACIIVHVSIAKYSLLPQLISHKAIMFTIKLFIVFWYFQDDHIIKASMRSKFILLCLFVANSQKIRIQWQLSVMFIITLSRVVPKAFDGTVYCIYIPFMSLITGQNVVPIRMTQFTLLLFILASADDGQMSPVAYVFTYHATKLPSLLSPLNLLLILIRIIWIPTGFIRWVQK